MIAIGQASASKPELPWNTAHIHVGVATCAGSNCHGSQRPFDDSPVLQNEYFTWQRDDAHSNAYRVLQTPEAERMASNLGLGKPTEATECLTCHTDLVPADRRGRRFRLSEGVGCEACHGGAQDWLGPHVTDNTHQENIAQGLYPLSDPVHRARLCLHCHLGSTDKPIDHRLMGAGHPPLEFELDTFTNIQPAHFRVDADYRQRKPYTAGAKTWAIGQLIAAEFFLDGLSSRRFADRGMFPELVFFDCTACHHPMRPPRWNAGVGGPLGPGEVRLADAYLVMSQHVLSQISPDLGAQWRAALIALHNASGKSVPEVKQVANTMRGLLTQGLELLRQRDISREQALALMAAITDSGIARDSGDFTAAKQIFYGLEALSTYLAQNHGVSTEALKRPMDELFAAVDAGNNYDPAKMRSALQRARSAIRTLAGS